MESFREFFATEMFMPHGHCYLWQPSLLWVQVLSNGLIGLAYMSITVTLLYLVQRIRDIPFEWMYLAFAIFIVTCGFTHFMDVWVIWKPYYWLDGAIRSVTALASVATAVALPFLVPKAVALARGAQAAHEKGIELESAVKDLGTMYERTKELEELKTQFFANVSHELRTPLALILGPVEKLLGATNLTGPQRHDLEIVARNAEALLKQVNDLLDVSKLEAGKVQPDYVRADLAKVVRTTASQFEAIAAERTIDYRVEGATALPAEVDPSKVERIVVNLLSNAFKFTPAGGHILCALVQEGEHAALRVQDSGPGVRAEHREAIFERFRQLEGGSTRRFGGTGLGLAITRDFAALHGGTIEVADAPGGGALFTVRLPLRAPPGTPVQERPASAEVPEQVRHAVAEVRARVDAFRGAQSADRPRLLVAEDNPELNRFLCETFADEYAVEPAFDGAEALHKVGERKPDLILTDVMMPRLSGDELVAEVRKRPELADVPIVLLTAKADDELRVRLLREGAQDYVMKPFSVAELRARVGNLMTIKRAKELLREELHSQTQDLQELAREASEHRQQLQTAVESLRVAREQAERASRLKSDFLGMVSHELRTPLTGMKLQLERLRRDEEEVAPKQRELLDRMAASTDRLVGLVESLLDFGAIQAGRLTVRREPCDLVALAREVTDELRPQADQRGLELKLTTSVPELSAVTDPRVLRLVVTNLVANALKFTHRGMVEVRVDPSPDDLVIAVRDTGPGIAAEQQARVFEPFEQLESMRAKHTPGIGLGLALVREMVSALGGRVTLDSVVGQGSTFTVTIPRGPAV